jgi:glycosyltransferase involved in cell wall biosynthesis
VSHPKILLAQIGARKHYQEPLLLHQWNVLDIFYTDFYTKYHYIEQVFKFLGIYHRTPKVIQKGFDRYEAGLKEAKIVHFPDFAWRYARALQQTKNQSATYIQFAQEFCQRIIKHGLGNADTVYGFNGASLELFEYAKSRGLRCVLDQTLAHRSLLHQLLLAEEERWLDWSISPFEVTDADQELVKREHQEQTLADQIICGSQFVQNSLIHAGIPAEKIAVVALGRCKENQTIVPGGDRLPPQQRGDGLRILFVGAVGLRKGIPYLLEALRALVGVIPFTCKVAGSLEIQPQRVNEYKDVCEFLGVVPRSQMAELYTWADVLVLPSLCEGSAMVTYEALNWGLPLITTENAGSIVRDGIDGFLVPPDNDQEISIKLKSIYFNQLQPQPPKQIQHYLETTNQQALAAFKQAVLQNWIEEKQL